MQKRMEEIVHKGPLAKAEENYQRTQMQEELIFRKLRNMGCRITKQRQLLLNIILQEECASCKEIYYKARKEDPRIGTATVYRMINLLEEIGAINRKNMYTIPVSVIAGTDDRECQDRNSKYAQMKAEKEIVCVIELEDHTFCTLSAREWNQVVAEGLKNCGYTSGQNITNIRLFSCTEIHEQKEADITNPVIERISQQGKIDGK